MTRRAKTIQAMRHNPKGDWSIDDLKKIAERFGLISRQPGTSHVTFRSKCGQKLTVPAHKPLKPIYVKLFVDLIDQLNHEED